MACRACGLEHSPMLRCEVHRRRVEAERATAELIAKAAMVVHKASAAAVVHASRHGQYADIEKRRAYRREWMRKKRAERGD